MNWITTLPKTVSWATYRRELAEVANWYNVMNYRVAFFPKGLKAGDACFICHDGRVRGWMEVVGQAEYDRPWACSTTGTVWPAGKYILRSGPFHELPHPPPMVGFRGVRKYTAT